MLLLTGPNILMRLACTEFSYPVTRIGTKVVVASGEIDAIGEIDCESS